MVGGFKMERGAEFTLIIANINVQKYDMGLGSVSSKMDMIVTVELFKECNGGVMTLWPE